MNNSKSRIIFEAIDRLGHPETFTTHQVLSQLLDKNYKHSPSPRQLSQFFKSSPFVKKLGVDHGFVVWALTKK